MVRAVSWASALGRLLLLALPALGLYWLFTGDVLRRIDENPWYLAVFFAVLLVARLLIPVLRRVKRFATDD